MKLISMQDFVIQEWEKDLYTDDFAKIVKSYADFLKQPLKLEMFINLNNNNDEVLFKGFYVKMYDKPQDGILGVIKDDNFQFKGIWHEGEEGFRLNDVCAKQRIEDLRSCNELTQVAIDRIFG